MRGGRSIKLLKFTSSLRYPRSQPWDDVFHLYESNVLAIESSRGLRGSLKMNQEHFSKKDFTIELLTYEEAFDLKAESVPQQQELEATR